MCVCMYVRVCMCMCVYVCMCMYVHRNVRSQHNFYCESVTKKTNARPGHQMLSPSRVSHLPTW